MTREEVLDAAKACVLKDRNALYDSPERNFESIAALWSQYTGREFRAHDVAVMMALVKVSRIMTSPQHPDHWVDLAGYAACGAECATGDEEGKVREGMAKAAQEFHETVAGNIITLHNLG
jgi:hypothetical protein